MAHILLLFAFIGTTVAQLKFDPMGNPLFEVMTAPPNTLPVPSPAFDNRKNPSAILQPTISAPQSADLSQSSSPRFSPPLHSSLPPPLPPQAPSLQQRVGEEGQPRLALPTSLMQRQQVMTAPLPPNLQPLPNRFRDIFNSRIRAEGFEFIERRFTVSRRKRSQVSSKGKRSLRFDDSGSSDYVEKFLSVNNSPVRRIRDAQSSDENNSVPDSTGVEGSGLEDINNEVPIFPSSKNLQKESAYQASVTQISSENSRSDNTIVETEPRLGLEETDTTRNSFSDEEEGSAVSENARMLEENAGVGVSKEITENSLIDDSLIYSILGIPRGHPPHENSIEVSGEEEEQDKDKEQTIDDSLQIDVKLPNSSENRSSVSVPPFVSSNSVSFLPNSRMLRIFKENIPLILGSILGIPAIVVLCYFMYLKRLKRYTGTLDVSPRPIYSQMKPGRKAKCSEKEELACSLSTSGSKTPQPPPFPTNSKKHIP